MKNCALVLGTSYELVAGNMMLKLLIRYAHSEMQSSKVDEMWICLISKLGFIPIFHGW